MENGALHSAHGGYDGITPDEHPMRPRGPNRFLSRLRIQRHWIKTAPAVDYVCQKLILDGKSKTVDLSIYSPQRFEEGKPIVGEHPYISIWR